MWAVISESVVRHLLALEQAQPLMCCEVWCRPADDDHNVCSLISHSSHAHRHLYRCISIIVCRVIMRLRQILISDSMDSTAGSRSWMSAQFIGNAGAPLDLSVRQERHYEDEDEEVVISVHGNPLIAGLEVAQLEDEWSV